jgi:hypothetical protein
VPYLSADRNRVAALRETLPRTSARRRVGLSWPGARSMPTTVGAHPLAACAPLLAMTGSTGIRCSGSTGGPDRARAGRALIPICATRPEAKAALMSTLDLVISVDTGNAHPGRSSAGSIPLPLPECWQPRRRQPVVSDGAPVPAGAPATGPASSGGSA